MSSQHREPELLTHDQVKKAAEEAVERALATHRGAAVPAPGAGQVLLPKPLIMGLIAIPQGNKFVIQEIGLRM